MSRIIKGSLQCRDGQGRPLSWAPHFSVIFVLGMCSSRTGLLPEAQAAPVSTSLPGCSLPSNPGCPLGGLGALPKSLSSPSQEGAPPEARSPWGVILLEHSLKHLPGPPSLFLQFPWGLSSVQGLGVPFPGICRSIFHPSPAVRLHIQSEGPVFKVSTARF